MRKSWFWLVILLCPLCPATDQLYCSLPEPRLEAHRSPVDVAVLPGGQRALTANHTSNSVSLVDLVAGRVLTEQACGHKPAGIACSRDGRRAAVSNLWSGTLTLLEVGDASLQSVGTVPVDALPRGLVFAPDGGSLYVAVAGANEVVQLDWQTHRVLHRWQAPTEPRRLALSHDGRYLAAASARSGEVRCWDLQDGRLVLEKRIVDAFNLHGLTFGADDRELIAAHVHDRHRDIAVPNIREGWALDNRLSRLTLNPDARSDYWQIALDMRGQAVADPCAAAFSSKGEWLVVAAAGTHEILLIQAAAVPWNSGDPGDLLDPVLDQDDGKFRRLSLGGRPMAVQFLEERNQVVVANYLLDALQLVDVKAGTLVRQIALGGPSQPSPARQGEAIFYDAKRSLHDWFSCHTCHPEGHTNGRAFDTLNDDSYGNPKLTPTLRGVHKTGPWTWHGWQDDLGQAVEKSLTETLFGPKPSGGDVQAVLAFLNTLDHPPNPHRGADGSLSAAAARGQAIFAGKGHCGRCHRDEHYTAAKNFDVKLEADGSPFDLWNPPSLRGVHDRGPYLHDGRAETLEELLRVEHRPDKLGGQQLTPEERRDLIEFLRSL